MKSEIRHWEKDIGVEVHDGLIKHFPYNGPFVRGIHRSSVISSHKGQWRGALMFSLIWTWINGWVNNREAGDLERRRVHYDITVMCSNVSWATCPLSMKNDVLNLCKKTAALLNMSLCLKYFPNFFIQKQSIVLALTFYIIPAAVFVDCIRL